MNLKDQVIQQFERNPNIRVLFFFDASQSFIDELDSWQDIHTIKVEGQYFSLKYRLETELRDKKVFLYFPQQEPIEQELEDFPLVDVLMANKQLYIDPVMAMIEDYNLPINEKDLIRKYFELGELKLKNRRDFLGSILSNDFSKRNFIRGLLAYHIGLRRPTENNNLIAAQVLSLALREPEFGDTLNRLRKLDLIDPLNKIYVDIFGDSFKDLTLSGIRDLTSRLKYNLLLSSVNRPIAEDQYAKLKEENPIRVSRLMSLFHDWESEAALKDKLLPVLDQLGGGIKEEKLITWYGLSQPFSFYTNSLKRKVVEECILLLESKPSLVKQAIKPWVDTLPQQNGIAPVIQYMWSAASFFDIVNDYKSFVFDSLSEYISRYEREFYLVDLHYRKAETAFHQSMVMNIDINLEKSVRALRDCYEKEFITPLNNEWMRCLKAFDFKLNSTTYNKQYNFYKDKVTSKQQRTAVIISDAFRYEAARELSEILSKDSKNSAPVGLMLASIPSVTMLGMANLLPNKGISVDDKGFAVNGIATEGTPNRTKILQSFNAKSLAIDFEELRTYDSERGRELMKTLDTIYIYHNKIDAKGDDRRTEKAVFEAVAETLDDLGIMVRKLNSWNVYRILITADHGFLASMREIPETMKEDIPIIEKEFMIRNRAIVGEGLKGASYECLLSDTTNIKTDLRVALPKSINRYRRPGSGVQYVHGGASLQELIVPVIEYSRMREDSSEKVRVRLIKYDERISSGYMKANILQVEPIATGLKELEMIVGLYSDQDDLVSNEGRIQLNSTSANPMERTKEITLTLTAKGTNLSHCVLKGYDVDDEQKLNPLFSQRILIQSLIQRDEFI